MLSGRLAYENHMLIIDCISTLRSIAGVVRSHDMHQWHHLEMCAVWRGTGHVWGGGASAPHQRATSGASLTTTRNVQGHTLLWTPGRPQGGGDYAALAYASRFKDPGNWTKADKLRCVLLYHQDVYVSWFEDRVFWTRVDKCGCVLLYHACALYLGIT
jgi:hypothetical protein